MVFSSLEFLFFFLPLTLGVFFLLPKRMKKYWLVAASFFFYAWGDPSFFFLFIITIVVNYSFGLVLDYLNRKIEKNESCSECSANLVIQTARIKRIIFIFSLLLNIGLLFVTKYLNFITKTIRTIIPVWEGVIPQTSFVLPMAVSFFTFQSVSYIFDIYRGMSAEKNPCNYALYIAFFPQLIQGPIIRYGDFHPQIIDHKNSIENFSEGIIKFLTGLNQKVLIANILSEVSDVAFGNKGISVGMAWLGMLAYSLQLYFDFSGYSDMAVGLGLMFGFRFKENFNFPYASSSISEFWRRWHISLGSWFRDYLYIPLGGSRSKSKIRVAFNIAVVWLATGIWHGANWTFVLWGCIHGIFVIFERLINLPKKIEKKPAVKFLYRGIVLLVTMYAWMIFRAADFSQIVTYSSSLLKLENNAWWDNFFTFNSREYIVTLIVAVICAFPLFRWLRNKISSKGEKSRAIVHIIWYLVQLLLGVVSVSNLVINSHNPFLYFNF